jgi:hypothetical protein
MISNRSISRRAPIHRVPPKCTHVPQNTLPLESGDRFWFSSIGSAEAAQAAVCLIAGPRESSQFLHDSRSRKLPARVCEMSPGQGMQRMKGGVADMRSRQSAQRRHFVCNHAPIHPWCESADRTALGGWRRRCGRHLSVCAVIGPSDKGQWAMGEPRSPRRSEPRPPRRGAIG